MQMIRRHSPKAATDLWKCALFEAKSHQKDTDPTIRKMGATTATYRIRVSRDLYAESQIRSQP